MAKKLNKKLAIFGAIFFGMFFLLAGIVGWIKFGPKDPQKYISKAQAAIESELYHDAVRYYSTALSATKTDKEKIALYFKLSELYQTNNTEGLSNDDPRYFESDWPKVYKCWYNIIQVDTKNLEARRKSLDFIYESADSSLSNTDTWNEVKKYATEYLDILKEQQKKPEYEVLKYKAIATFHIALFGGSSNPREKDLADAVNDLNELLRENDKDITIYEYLSRSEILKGKLESIKGVQDADQKAIDRAEIILQKAVDAMPDNPKAYIILLENEQKKIAGLERDLKKDAFAQIQSGYEQLAEKFPDSHEVHASIANLYIYQHDYDKAFKAIDKALQLKPNDIDLLLNACTIHYQAGVINGEQTHIDKAFAIIKQALDSPDVTDINGPRRNRNRKYKYQANMIFAKWSLDQIISGGQVDNKDALLEAAEESVKAIRSLFDKEDINGRKWEGILELAKGNKTEAIKIMNSCWQDLQTLDAPDSFLAYALSISLKDMPETGLRAKFLSSAIFSDSSNSMAALRPELILDYCQLLMDLKLFDFVQTAAGHYESNFGPNTRSSEIRASAYLLAGDIENAEDQLSNIPENSPEAFRVRFDLIKSKINDNLKQQASLNPKLDNYSEKLKPLQEIAEDLNQQRVSLISSILSREEKILDFSDIASLCISLIKEDETEQARKILESFIKKYPDNINAAIYLARLNEPDPNQITGQRQLEVVMNTIESSIKDPVLKGIEKARSYLAIGQLEKSQQEFQKAFEKDKTNKQAIEGLFELALMNKDWEKAREAFETAAMENIDECQGDYFSARMLFEKQDLDQAAEKINQVIEKRPIFSNAYLLRSKINFENKDFEQAMTDIKQAETMEPVSPVIAKQKAAFLQQQVISAGSNASEILKQNTEKALEKAFRLNPTDWRLQSIYAEFISQKNPDKAIAMRQWLARQFPNTENYLMLGNMAMKIAAQKNANERSAYIELAENSYQKAYSLDKNDKTVIAAYLDFLRLSNQQAKADELFKNDSDVLWKFYLNDGQYDKALDLLLEELKKDPENTEVLYGLIQVSSFKNDSAGIIKYTSALMKADNSFDNQLLQIQLFLDNAINPEETNKKLLKFTEDNPDYSKGIQLLALQALKNGTPEESIEILDGILKKEPDNALSLRLRGQAYRLNGSNEKAIIDLRKSKLLQSTPETQIELALAYLQQGEATTAIGELKDAVDKGIFSNRILIMLENLYKQEQRYKDLELFYQDILNKQPTSLQWNYRAGYHFMQREKYPIAQKLLENAWEFSNKQLSDSVYLDLFLESLYLGKNYDLLLSKAGEYIDSPLGPIAYAQMAQTMMAKEDKTKANEYYSKALEKAGNNAFLMIGVLKNMFKILGQDEVTRWCSSQLDSNPSSLAANYMMYYINLQQSQYNQALNYIDKCLSLEKDNYSKQIEYSLNKANILVLAYVKTGDKEYLSQSIDEFKKILNKQPYNMSVMNNLAYLLCDNDQELELALNYARKVYKTSPSDTNRMDTYAYALIKNNQFEEAEKISKKAIHYTEITGDSVPSNSYEHLAMAQEGLGKLKNAADSYKMALSAGENDLPKTKKQQLQEAIKRVMQ